MRIHNKLRSILSSVIVNGLAKCLAMAVGWSTIAAPAAAVAQSSGAAPAAACQPIDRRVPPPGTAPDRQQTAAWEARLNRLVPAAALLASPAREDIEVLLKACRWAIDFREFYQPRDLAKVDRLLALAEQRLEAAADNGSQPGPPPAGVNATKYDPLVHPDKVLHGRTVRGFRSAVDGTVQPIGLVFGSEVQQRAASGPVPLYVWLHGRGDKVTDLHFICQRLDSDGPVVPPGAIVLHPFGRQCLGYKSAGETDVLEAIEWTCEHYPIDRDRIVLMGFSMGGAGVWHLAAHYADRFVAASPGAGFAETAQYLRLTAEQYPPPWEQVLWNVYDCPQYVRNLFNFHVIAYSGELDRQIQAARVMEQAFKAHGKTLPHIIGPGMGHKYHPDSLQTILKQIHQSVQTGRPSAPTSLTLQTRHLRYNKMRWIAVDGMIKQYADTRVDARSTDDNHWTINTVNVSRLTIDASSPAAPQNAVRIDGQSLQLQPGQINLLQRTGSGWALVDAFPAIRKRHGLSGPIDDAFLEPFLIVLPSGTSRSTEVDRWVDCESTYIKQRWRYLFRGDARCKRDVDVTDEDIERFHLVLWGTPESNVLLRRVVDHPAAAPLPFVWAEDQVRVGPWSAPADRSVLIGIYPNPLNPQRYVVINSGPTFRDAHDRTNSLQNPHLPDWAILSLDEPRSEEAAGRVLHCGFFDDRWKVDPDWTWHSQ